MLLVGYNIIADFKRTKMVLRQHKIDWKYPF